MRRRSLVGRAVLVAVLVASVAIVALGSGLWRDGTAAVSPTPLPPVPVDDAVVVDGRAVPLRSAELGVAFAGRVVEVAVQPGDPVAAGALLVRLDTGSADAEVVAAEAALEAAAARIEQAQSAVEQAMAGAARAEAAVDGAEAARDLLPSNAPAARKRAADAEVVAAEAGLAAARAAVEGARAGVRASEADGRRAEAFVRAARAARDQLVITAPFAGTVVTVDVVTGDIVGPGLPLVRIADDSGWRFRSSELDEALVALVIDGAAVTIRLDGLAGTEIAGLVERVTGYGTDRRGDTVFTVVVVPDGPVPAGVRWNMTATLSIAAER